MAEAVTVPVRIDVANRNSSSQWAPTWAIAIGSPVIPASSGPAS
nr:hypothetical protein [Sphingobium xenophagum]